MIHIRPLKRDDDELARVGKLAGELVRMHHAVDPDRFLLAPNVEKGYAWWFSKQIDNPEAVILVAERDGEIIGYAYGAKNERDWNNLIDVHGVIHDIYVDESARRTGAGKKLMSAILEKLEAIGAPRILLYTMVGNVNAQALFKACGFRPTMIEMTR